MSTILEPGDLAPSFTLPEQHGDEVRDHRQELADLGVDVVGISPDEPAKQLAFDRKWSFGFPLLADTDHEVAEAWGTWGEKRLYGNTYMGIIRSSFLVGAEGRIEHAWYIEHAWDKVTPAKTVPLARATLTGCASVARP